MIDISELTVQFGSVTAINALSAQLTAPVCGLVGPNGAGKTSLLNTLSGFIRPVSGSITLDGISLSNLSPQSRVRLGVRRAFQTEQVVEDITVWDNVLALLDHLPVARETRNREISSALRFVGLEDRRYEMGCNLDLYQRRMLELAKALTGQPRLILLDEPGAGMNDAESRCLRQCISQIAAYCRAQVLLIDHDIDLIAATCAQTLVLDFGRCIANGPTAQVLNDAAVRKAYLGQA